MERDLPYREQRLRACSGIGARSNLCLRLCRRWDAGYIWIGVAGMRTISPANAALAAGLVLLIYNLAPLALGTDGLVDAGAG